MSGFHSDLCGVIELGTNETTYSIIPHTNFLNYYRCEHPLYGPIKLPTNVLINPIPNTLFNVHSLEEEKNFLLPVATHFGFDCALEWYKSFKESNRSLYCISKLQICYNDQTTISYPMIYDLEGRPLSARAVLGAILQWIKNDIINKLNEQSISKKPLYWIVIVNSVWSRGIQQLIREAAMNAALYQPDKPQYFKLLLDTDISLKPEVVSRVAPFTIGHCISKLWDKNLHRGLEQFLIDKNINKIYCKNLFNKFIGIGETIPSDKLTFLCTALSSTQTCCDIDIYIHRTDPNPLSIKDCTQVGRLSIPYAALTDKVEITVQFLDKIEICARYVSDNNSISSIPKKQLLLDL